MHAQQDVRESEVTDADLCFLALCLGLAGCARAPSEAPAAAPIPVTVSYPVERDVTDYADFTGRTAAVDSVEVRARVWGYLDKVNFKEGALVKKGDVLFEIDPRPYRADLERAKGTVAQDEARVHRLERDYQRAKNLIVRGAVGQEEYDRYEGDYREAVANLDVAKANRDLAALNLEYTKVTAPVSGRVSRYVVTVGNLIQSGDQNGGTLLTTIVSVDPMYAYFDVDERTVLRVRQLIREGKAKSARETEWPVSLGLANEEGFPHQGTINFVDNQVNPKTGTLRVRGVFPNKDEALSPGFFARVRVPIGRAPPGPAGHRPRHRHRPGPEDPLRRQREERGGLPPRPAGGAPRRPAGDRGRPEAGRAGDRQRPAAGPAGRHRRAEARGHADLGSPGSRRLGERGEGHARFATPDPDRRPR